MGDLGGIFYRGPSQLTGAPIMGVLTGLERGSDNPKTGRIAQAWILRADRAPMDAVRDGADDAICGDCALRGDGAYGRKCYVTVFQGPHNVWKMRDRYRDLDQDDVQALLEGRTVRLGAYGDPAAIPFEVWDGLLATVAGWIGYTHQFRTCDPRFARIVMASVETVDDFWAARRAGWRTFRIRPVDGPLVQDDDTRHQPLEFVCPASDEANHRVTCEQCQLCRGTSSPARSVAILPHGKPGNLKAFGIDVTGRFPGRPRTLVHLQPITPSPPAARTPTVTTADATSPKTEPAATGPVAPPEVSRRAVPPRCSRCFQPFRPTSADDYQCVDCHAKPLRPPQAEPELVPHWRPHRDAQALTGGAAGMGSTLAGSDFRVIR